MYFLAQIFLLISREMRAYMKYFNKPRVRLHNIHPSLEFWAKTKEVQGDVSRCA